jgi:cyclopropane-fatty-acyl-phospholipid synthase
MLAVMHAGLSCERAQLKDGQSILELGCGWGSMCLYVAARFPRSRVTAVSNSATQKALIDERAQQRGLTNLVLLAPPSSPLGFPAPHMPPSLQGCLLDGWQQIFAR